MIMKKAYEIIPDQSHMSSDVFVNMRLNELLKKEHQSQIRNHFIFGISDSYQIIDFTGDQVDLVSVNKR